MLEKRQTACPMDCPDGCSLEITVEDDRVLAINGSHANPTTAGFICAKVRNFHKRLYSPERILYPMKRVGLKGSASFERITWDEAVQTIVREFSSIRDRFGGEAILPYSYGGSNGFLGQDTIDYALFARLGASRLKRTVCAAPTGTVATEMYGKMAGVAFEDYPNAKLIVIWGANPKHSNIHLVPFLKKAKARGARIVVVDPMLNFSDRECDLYIPVYPGTDVVVALSLIHYWHKKNLFRTSFLNKHSIDSETLLEKAEEYPIERAAEIARVPVESILQLADWYAVADPALIRVGWGLERNKNGGQAVAAILAIPALMGKFGVPGGGYTLSNSGVIKVKDDELVNTYPWNTRTINMNELGKRLLTEQDPPIKALFVYNSNPVATTPNQNAVVQGLERNDLFTVVFDQILTDTAHYADVLLPAVTFLEQEELKRSYGSYAFQYLAPTIPACGEALPNERVFGMIGKAMGWDDPIFQHTTEDLLRRVANRIAGLGRSTSLEEIRENRVLAFDFPGPYPVQFHTVYPATPDGKIHLKPACLGDRPFEYQPNENHYPLALISPASEKTISSSMAEYTLPELTVTVNPQDAISRNLSSGSMVRVYNDLGEVHCKMIISDSVRSGVVSMPKGAWRKSSRNKLTVTALSPDTLGTAGGACFNDARVEVEAL